MCVLTRNEILKRIREGTIRIEPLSEDQIGPASIDLHLDNQFRVFKEVQSVYEVTDEANLEEITKPVTIEEGDSLVLKPGESCQGITRERITLPGNVCGWLWGRSRFARLGLVIHATASFVQPGVDNKQVLEISNTGPIPLAIQPGLAICQLCLEECRGEAVYEGRFHAQISP